MKSFRAEVEEVRTISTFCSLSPIRTIKRAFDFAKWMGHFPVIMATNRLGFVTVRFMGCHFATFLWFFTVVLQIFTVIGNYVQLQRFTRVVTVTLLAFVHLTSYYGSCIAIPRLGLARKHLLKSLLSNLIEAHTLLFTRETLTVSFIPWIVIVSLEVAAMLPDVALPLVSSEMPFVFGPHPIFRLGTGNAAFGLVIQTLSKLYCNISIWIVPLQFFSVCQHTAKSFEVLGDRISDIARARARERFPCQELDSAKPDTNYSLEDQLRIANAALVKLVKTVNALNAYFGFPMLAFLTFRFLNIVGNLHFSISFSSHLTAGSYNVLDITNSVRSLTRDVSGLLFVIWTGDLLSAAVARFKQQVWEMPYVEDVCISVWDFQNRSCANYFRWMRNQINVLQLDASAFGFFPIGRSIIPPILGAITTYFLIIVQYASSDPLASSDAAKTNSTIQ